MAAIALPEKGSNAKDTGADSPASSGTDPTKQKFPVGGIVGAVIGAVLILALAVFLFRVWKRRRTVADETGTEKSDLSSDDMIPVPYINNSSIQRSSKMLNSQHPTTDETGPRIH
ncbi:hypothetical protein MPER_05927 [Moniliophthora perniciosa FA553]|nr:hypothetical protein MPER_05927 [Moniliophthora perniciosa FA553]